MSDLALRQKVPLAYFQEHLSNSFLTGKDLEMWKKAKSRYQMRITIKMMNAITEPDTN
jgi:hypothetical protein